MYERSSKSLKSVTNSACSAAVSDCQCRPSACREISSKSNSSRAIRRTCADRSATGRAPVCHWSCPVAPAERARRDLPDLLVDELDDLRDRLPAGWRRRAPRDEPLGRALVQLELDLASRLAIVHDEAIEVRARM